MQEYVLFESRHGLSLEKIVEYTDTKTLEFVYTTKTFQDCGALAEELKTWFPFVKTVKVVLHEAAEDAPEPEAEAEPETEPEPVSEDALGEREAPAQTFSLEDWQREQLTAREAEIKHYVPKAAPEPDKPEMPLGPGEILLGKAIRTPVVPIETIDFGSAEQSRGVCIEGEVLSVECKDISEKTTLYTFAVTDCTGSVYVKRFVPKKNAELTAAFETNITPGRRFKILGALAYDEFLREKVMSPDAIECLPEQKRVDAAPEKRVELHMHTQYSAMDAVSKTKKIVARAKDFGHDALGITDHGVLQAYPEIQNMTRGSDIKVLYGLEGYLVDTGAPIVTGDKNALFNGDFIFFDLETTGTSIYTDNVIEIAAVRVSDGRVLDSYQTFVNPHEKLSPEIVALTHITDEMLASGKEEDEAFEGFLAFCGEDIIAAHNAVFDTGFLNRWLKKTGRDFAYTVIDTLPMARTLLPEIARYNMGRLCSYFKIKNAHAHRAIDDALASAKVMLKLFERAQEKGVSDVAGLNALMDTQALALKQPRPWHIILYAKNQRGIRDLYEIVSESHLNYFYKKPRLPRALIEKKRENLLIGSACEAGELFQAVEDGAPDDVLECIAAFYDYLEVQPLGNNVFLTEQKSGVTEETLKDYNRRIVALGERLGKPVVATGDVHFVDPEDAVFREILQHGQKFKDAARQPPIYYRSTEEMLREFDYLGPEKAYEIVVTNTRKIAEAVEAVKPVPDGTYPPVIEGADEDIRTMCETRAHELYGEDLPEIVRARMDKELNSIISNGYAVLYLIAQKLVRHSEEDGYLVGSRGSVGSSFVAMLCGITEVNALPPHYVCPDCHYSEFIETTEFVGPDLPDKMCPHCGTPLKKDGFDIPFETFLGFEGDKEPDIDLNFSGDNQAQAHAFTEVLFGKGKTFRAGTISTLAEKTAFGYVRNYFDEKNKMVSKAEIERLKDGCSGVKRTTGQHPGGIMVVPRDRDICEFTPVQHPADDADSGTVTTHFDYHSISGRLLKLDILGHDDPTILRHLQNMTGVDPRSIPLDDKDVISLFTGVEALDFKTPCALELGTAGVPEFGTPFVKQMVKDTKPTAFADLIRISGLSHGTDVWNNNAQELIRSRTATIKEVICTRDDIMLGLIAMGLPPKASFNIMEKVRKGKGLTPEAEALMRKHNVPDWYIGSCKKIGYMFPKAHAAAYVIMAFRIAWYKIHYPLEYYACYFGIRAKEFDLETISAGLEAIQAEMARLEQKNRNGELSNKEALSQISLELALEMYCRGYSCSTVDLKRSHYKDFRVADGALIPPFTTINGLGEAAAQSLYETVKTGNILSQEELLTKTRLTKTNLAALEALGCLSGIPKSRQVTFF